MANTVKFRGALTFENDDDMAEALAVVAEMLAEAESQLLTKDEIEPLGLHLMLNHTTQGNPTQVENSQQLIHTLAAHAYSGYIDVVVDGAQKRFHAKEIEPKHVELADIVED